MCIVRYRRRRRVQICKKYSHMSTRSRDMRMRQKRKKPNESSRPGIMEAVQANISCASSFVSAYVHVLLLDRVREMIRFSSNVFALQSDPTTPPSTYSHHN